MRLARAGSAAPPAGNALSPHKKFQIARTATLPPRRRPADARAAVQDCSCDHRTFLDDDTTNGVGVR
jgi:hypothetical protein